MTKFLLSAALAAAFVAPAASVGLATASIDIGSEWMKVGLVKPGVPMDIVLNDATKRKTNAFIGLRDNERTFSSGAMVTATKYPQFAFGYLFELLGEQVGSDVVNKYAERFPEHTIVADETRGTVTFKLKDTTYTIEELLAQIVDFGVKCAADTAEQDISGVVFTVPPYFTQAQRKALLLVGELANVKVLQLLNSPTAIAMNYGVFRAKDFNETARNIMFYDMGAQSTIASIVQYKTVKDKKSKSTDPQLEIMGIGYDRTLGGVEFDFILRDHLLAKFLENPKVKPSMDVKGSPRAMAKLFYSAQKTKKVLSANKETQARVEGLYEEIDFRTSVSREEFEEMTAPLFERVTIPIEDALAMANMTKADIDEIIVFGGGQRIPKVQQALKDFMEVDKLGMSINGDEAAVLGASYHAAKLSKAFRLKKFAVRDASIFPVALSYEKPVGDEGKTKLTTVKLFNKLNLLPQKKIFRFKNISGDVSFDLKYGDVSFLKEEEQAKFAKADISSHDLTKVADAYTGHEEDDAQGIKVHFELTANGIVKVDKAYVEFKREPEPEPEPEPSVVDDLKESESEGEGEGDADAEKKDGEGEGEGEGEGDADAEKKDEGEGEDEGEGKGEDAEKKDADADDADAEKKDADADDADADAEKKDGEGDDADEEKAKTDKKKKKKAKKAKKEPAPPPPPKALVFKPAVDVASAVKDIAAPSDEDVEAARGRISALVAIETEKRERAEAMNDLESFIFGTRDKMESENILKVTNESQRELIGVNLTFVSEWLEEDGWEANTTMLKKHHKILTDATKACFGRAAELIARPKAIDHLKTGLNATTDLIARVKKLNAESQMKNTTQWITDKALEGLEKIYDETTQWLADKEEAQAATELTEQPVFKVKDIKAKSQKLDIEAMYIAKTPKPRPPKKPKRAKNWKLMDDCMDIVTNSTNQTLILKNATKEAARKVDYETIAKVVGNARTFFFKKKNSDYDKDGVKDKDEEDEDKDGVPDKLEVAIEEALIINVKSYSQFVGKGIKAAKAEVVKKEDEVKKAEEDAKKAAEEAEKKEEETIEGGDEKVVDIDSEGGDSAGDGEGSGEDAPKSDEGEGAGEGEGDAEKEGGDVEEEPAKDEL